MFGWWNVLTGLRDTGSRDDPVGGLMLTYQQKYYAAARAARRLGGVLVDIAETTSERGTHEKVVAALNGTLHEEGHETLYFVPPFGPQKRQSSEHK